jgi:hypothetical protein
VNPVLSFSGLDEAVRPAAAYGLSPGILTRDVMEGLALAESGNGSRHGGANANLDAFTEMQWVTMRGDLPRHPSRKAHSESGSEQPHWRGDSRTPGRRQDPGPAAGERSWS